jgi:putative acetyltransferase
MFFRIAKESDLKEMQALFFETISAICSSDYTELQINAWTSAGTYSKYWLELVESQFVLLALIDGKIVGYGTLKDDNYLDLFYVDKGFQSQGIGSEILLKMEERAKSLNSKFITAAVSITAKPFFEKNGFVVLKEQRISRNDIELINYIMEKKF